MTYTERLVEAEAAYHRLCTGSLAVEIHDSNGETIRFVAAQADRLASYITVLKSLIAGTSPVRTIRFQSKKGL